MKKVTSQMVADRLGISRATVSRALNGHVSIPQETAERVIRAAQELDYRFTPRGGRRNIGVILYRNAVIYSYLTMALSAIRAEALHRNYRLELVSISDIGLLGERVLSGVIDLSHDFSLNERWGNFRNLPMVRLYGPRNHGDGIYAVHSDGPGSIQCALEYLWKRGHRRIGFLSDLPYEEETRRQLGYYPTFLQFLRERGELAPETLAAFAKKKTREVRSGIGEVCRRGVTALFCVNEAYGPRAAQIIQKLGYRIPEDISLIVIDSFEVSQYLTPPQTGIRQDYPAMARAAFDLLDLLMSGKTPASDAVVPTQLIERGSVKTIHCPDR